MKTVAIIGGGASGLACAVELRRLAAESGAAVNIVIYESTDKIGRSILQSGNGRCNFSNANIAASKYFNDKFVSSALDAFESGRKHKDEHVNGVVSFFEELGLLWREESDGRLYPLANKASAVLSVLREPLLVAPFSQISITIQTESYVEFVDPPQSAGGHFTLRMRSNELQRADMVVVACGGHVASKMLPPEIAFNEMHPVLCPIACEGKRARRMENIRVKCTASLLREGTLIAVERGEVMFRKYGLSGIAIFNLSRDAEFGDTISLDLMPDIDEERLVRILEGRASDLRTAFGQDLTNRLFMNGMQTDLVSDVILSDCALDPEARFLDDSIDVIARNMKDHSFTVEGMADTGHAQCHRGGFAVEDFDAPTMQSNDIDGLYLTGEALDVDGPCGGYNLHWAFATGILAARNISSRL